MPRSKNLSNYDESFWDLRDAMEKNIGEMKLHFSKKEAINIQQSFYAFIRAHEHTGNRMVKEGKIEEGMELIRHANTMRGYLVQVTHNPDGSILRFVNRELNPTTKDMKEQIAAELERMDTPKNFKRLPRDSGGAPAVVKSTQANPPIPSMFAPSPKAGTDLKHLGVKDGTSSGDNAEEQT